MAVSVGINAYDNLEEFAISVTSNYADGVSVSVNYGTFACSGFSISGCGAVSYTHLTLPTNREV